jgi:phage terminase small subunit
LEVLMPGPAKTPRAFKVIAGTDRKDRRPADDTPQYPKVGASEFPKPPQHLNVDGAALWKELGGLLVKSGVLQVPDLYALEQLCYAWQRFRKKAKADMDITASEDNALKALWAEFGLTPAARRRVVANVGAEAPPANRFSAHGKRTS